MIYRSVFFKQNDKNNDIAESLERHVEKIRREITEVKKYHFTRNLGAGNDEFDWVILATFADIAAMNAYLIHPTHQSFVEFCDIHMDSVVACYYATSDEI